MRKQRQLDDPRSLNDAAAGAVIFAFGSLGPDYGSWPGPALVEFLGAIGMSEPTARATILRMRRSGRLVSERRGRFVEYSLAAPSRALASEVLAPIVGERPAWDGLFHGLLFSIPESGRAYRDALRRAAVLAGFGLLRPGLLVVTDESRWTRIASLLQGAPRGSRLLRVELRLAPEDARAAAAEAWPLQALADAYRQHAADLRRTTDRLRSDPPAGPSAATAMWAAMTPVSRTAIDDPALPVELLPRDWPGPEIRKALLDLLPVVAPGLQAYIRELMADRQG